MFRHHFTLILSGRHSTNNIWKCYWKDHFGPKFHPADCAMRGLGDRGVVFCCWGIQSIIQMIMIIVNMIIIIVNMIMIIINMIMMIINMMLRFIDVLIVWVEWSGHCIISPHTPRIFTKQCVRVAQDVQSCKPGFKDLSNIWGFLLSQRVKMRPASLSPQSSIFNRQSSVLSPQKCQKKMFLLPKTLFKAF